MLQCKIDVVMLHVGTEYDVILSFQLRSIWNCMYESGTSRSTEGSRIANGPAVGELTMDGV